MRVGRDHLLHPCLAVDAAPDLGPAVKDPLVAGRAVDHRRLGAVQRQAVGFQRERHPGQVADVLAHGQAALDVEARQGLIAVVLGAQPRRLGLEAGLVLRGPPFAQHAGAVGLAALVVEAVADLVADDAADAAVVHGRVRVRVEKRRLQDRGREDDLVLGWRIVGVHRLGRHAPLVVVDRPAQAVHPEVPLEGARAQHVADHVVRPDLQTRIITPLVRIADLDAEQLQLGQRLGAGFRAHPFQGLDARGHGAAQVLDQLLHLGAALRWEPAFDIKPAQRLAHHGLGEGDAATLAGALLGLAAQLPQAEGVVRVREPLRQQRRRLVHDVEGLPGLQRLDRRLGEGLGDQREGRVLRDDEAVMVAIAGGAQEGVPVHARRGGLKLGPAHWIVGAVAVAALGRGPVGLGDARLEGDDRVGRRRRILPSRHGQHLLDIGAVSDQLGREPLFQIVVPVRQAQAALAQIGLIDLRVAGVVIDEAAEDRSPGAAIGLAHQRRHGRVIVRGAHGVQQRLYRRRIRRLDRRHVHEAGVEVVDLGFVRPRRQALGRRDFLDQRPHAVLGQLGQHVEGAVACAVRRDFQRVQEQAVGEPVEVVARRHRGVPSGHVEAPGPERGRLGAVDQPDGGLGALSVQADQRHHGAGFVDAGAVVVLGQGWRSDGQGDGAGGHEDGAFHGCFLELTGARGGAGRDRGTIGPRSPHRRVK